MSESKMNQSFPTWTFDKPCTSIEWTGLADVNLVVADEPASKEALGEAGLVLLGVMAPPKKDGEDEGDDDEKKEPSPMELGGLAKEVDGAVAGSLSEVLAETVKTFKNGAKMGSTTPVVRVVSDGASKRYALLGLGATPAEEEEKKKKDDKDPFEGAGFALGKAIADACAGEKKVKSCAVVLPEALCTSAKIIRDLSSSFYQSMYSDNRYRTGDKVKKLDEDLDVVKILSVGAISESASESVEKGKKLATGVYLSRDIVNSPHNVMNSLSLADTARRIAEQSNGTITCEILDKGKCEELGMGAYLAVARGSETDPQFIHLTYTPPGDGKVTKKVGLVGKGLLFDTGGYNIKVRMMELMKFDCGGSAAVLGGARAIGAIAPPGVEAHFFVAACENMINAKAYVPSDILTASNGKTIEVINTDAEGRLTLADALVYADKEIGCETIVEFSTLTGTMMAALGKKLAGVFSKNDDLAEELDKASKSAGDKTWRMPMPDEYNEQLESKIADISNLGGPWGGAITAALFLQNFVSAKKPFAHIDMAGPVWDDKTGATGFGAKMIAEWVEWQGKQEE